jgi:alkylation response protein AidB-like acyl-CoA dehydrogenase
MPGQDEPTTQREPGQHEPASQHEPGQHEPSQHERGRYEPGQLGPTSPHGTTFEDLAARFGPVFARIGTDALAREQRETLATEQLGWLIETGFARLRTPVDRGGFGASLGDLFRLVTELAEVDPNLAHVWRNHFSFVEDRLHDGRSARNDDLVNRLGRGEIVGGGWSEAPNATTGDITTVLRPDPSGSGWRVTGAKYYSTGSVYARWITVLAKTEDGERFVALVDATDDGVRIGDDWDGFGQRVTGSGSVRYTDVFVPEDRVLAYADRYPYQEHYYQTFMHAILVGIGRAVVRDGIAALRARGRSHRNGTTEDPTEDPEILETVGTVAARVFAAESALAATLGPIDALVAAHASGSPDEDDLATAAWIGVAQAQSVITDAVLDAATLVFDALGASGTNRSIALDRHWRNARTLASHNPRIFKRRLVGDWLVNGTDPVVLPDAERAGPAVASPEQAAGRARSTPLVVALADELVATAIQRRGGLDEVAAGLERAGVDVVVLGSDRFRTDVDAGGPRVDPSVAALGLGRAAPALGVLVAAGSTRDHPYNTARRILSVDHLTAGRAGVVLGVEPRDVAGTAAGTDGHGLEARRGSATDGTAAGADGHGLEARRGSATGGTTSMWTDRTAGPELIAETADVLRGLWNTWPLDSIVADRDAGVFADPTRITLLGHEGAHRVAGPLNTPSSPQGEPVLATWGDLGVADAELVLDPDQVRRIATLDDLATLVDLRDLAGTRDLADLRDLAGPDAPHRPASSADEAVASRASSPGPGPAQRADGPHATLRAILGLDERHRDTTGAQQAFGAGTTAVGAVSVPAAPTGPSVSSAPAASTGARA